MLLKECYLFSLSYENGIVKKRTTKGENSPQYLGIRQGLWGKLLRHHSPHCSGTHKAQVPPGLVIQGCKLKRQKQKAVPGGPAKTEQAAPPVCRVADVENRQTAVCRKHCSPPASPSHHRQGWRTTSNRPPRTIVLESQI